MPSFSFFPSLPTFFFFRGVGGLVDSGLYSLDCGVKALLHYLRYEDNRLVELVLGSLGLIQDRFFVGEKGEFRRNGFWVQKV